MKYCIILLIFFSPSLCSAQKFGINIFGGIANYQGDLQSNKFADKNAKLAIGAGLQYNISNKFVVRTGFTYGKIEGNDKQNVITKGNAVRNLSFSTAINEGHIVLEYNFFELEEKTISPYIFAGVALYHFNPFTTDATGAKVYLHPLSTEGQGLDAYPNKKPYNLTQFAIPFGGGLKIRLNNNVQVALEIGLRKLFTDYLDDVSDTYADYNLLLNAKGAKAVQLAFRGNEIVPSAIYPAAGTQRGNPKSNDWYYFSGVRLSKTIDFSAMKRGGGSEKLGCNYKVM